LIAGIEPLGALNYLVALSEEAADVMLTAVYEELLTVKRRLKQ
jgi:hypothetical protein